MYYNFVILLNIIRAKRSKERDAKLKGPQTKLASCTFYKQNCGLAAFCFLNALRDDFTERRIEYGNC